MQILHATSLCPGCCHRRGRSHAGVRSPECVASGSVSCLFACTGVRIPGATSGLTVPRPGRHRGASVIVSVRRIAIAFRCVFHAAIALPPRARKSGYAYPSSIATDNCGRLRRIPPYGARRALQNVYGGGSFSAGKGAMPLTFASRIFFTTGTKESRYVQEMREATIELCFGGPGDRGKSLWAISRRRLTTSGTRSAALADRVRFGPVRTARPRPSCNVHMDCGTMCHLVHRKRSCVPRAEADPYCLASKMICLPFSCIRLLDLQRNSLTVSRQRPHALQTTRRLTGVESHADAPESTSNHNWSRAMLAQLDAAKVGVASQILWR